MEIEGLPFGVLKQNFKRIRAHRIEQYKAFFFFLLCLALNKKNEMNYFCPLGLQKMTTLKSYQLLCVLLIFLVFHLNLRYFFNFYFLFFFFFSFRWKMKCVTWVSSQKFRASDRIIKCYSREELFVLYRNFFLN